MTCRAPPGPVTASRSAATAPIPPPVTATAPFVIFTLAFSKLPFLAPPVLAGGLECLPLLARFSTTAFRSGRVSWRPPAAGAMLADEATKKPRGCGAS
jgi:hypothetical protein